MALDGGRLVPKPFAAAAERAMPSLDRVTSGREPRIVVLDPEPSMRACVEMILREENYRVFAAPGAREAFQHMRTHGADLLLLDVKPNAGGFALVEWLRADPALAHIAIIVFTSAHEERRARRLGVFDYINRPVGRDELLESVFRGVCMGVMGRMR
jgi:CheY-like chemotaxis protein